MPNYMLEQNQCDLELTNTTTAINTGRSMNKGEV